MAPKEMVECETWGCTGSCPLFVVNRSNKRDGIPAKCFECGEPYLWSKVGNRRGGTQGGNGQNPKNEGKANQGQNSSALKERQHQLEIKKLQKQVRDLQIKASPQDKLEEPNPLSTQEQGDKEKKEIARLQNLLEGMEKNGADADMLQKVQEQLVAAKARKAAAKPLPQQIQDAERRLERNKKAALEKAKARDETKAAHDKLVVESRELDAKGVLLEAEVRDLLAKRCDTTAPQAKTLHPEDVELFKGLLKLLPQQDLQTKCEQSGIMFEGILAKTTAAVAKLEALAVAPAAVAGANGFEVNAANFEKLQEQVARMQENAAQVQEQMAKMEEDYPMDSDEESVAPSESSAASPPARAKKKLKTSKFKERFCALRAAAAKC
jgi:hypothetical protein